MFCFLTIFTHTNCCTTNHTLAAIIILKPRLKVPQIMQRTADPALSNPAFWQAAKLGALGGFLLF